MTLVSLQARDNSLGQAKHSSSFHPDINFSNNDSTECFLYSLCIIWSDLLDATNKDRLSKGRAGKGKEEIHRNLSGTKEIQR